MKSYKNKTTGIVGELKEDGHLHFERGDERMTCHESIWFGFVENSCDWEEMVAKDYEIICIKHSTYGLMFKDNSGLFSYVCANSGGFCYNLEEGLKNGMQIFSVERLSDREVFTVGDKAQTIGKYPHTITSIEIRQKSINRGEKDGIDRIWLNWEENAGGNWLENSELVKEPLFISFDGEKMYKGDSAWAVTEFFDLMEGVIFDGISNLLVFAKKESAEEYIRAFKNYKTVDGKQIKEGNVFYCYDNKRFKCIETKFGQFKASKWDGKRYRTEEEVKELIDLEKPQYSLQQVEKALSGSFFRSLEGIVIKNIVIENIKNGK